MTDRAPREPPAHGPLVDRLVADVGPVRRLWPPRLRTLVWLGVGLTVLAWSVGGGGRPDLAAELGHPGFVVQVAALLVAATFLATLAFAAAVPGRAPGGAQLLLAAAIALGAWLMPAGCPAETDLSLARFVDMALACERRTTLLAVPSLTVLLIGIRRGAPLRGALAGSLAGAAAFLLAAANMRLVCPIDTRLHLVVGHSLPGLAGVVVSAGVGASWLRGWRLGSAGRRLLG
jgi:hypothetical protein